MISRRKFLRGAIGTAALAVLPNVLRITDVSPAAVSISPAGWGVCVPSQLGAGIMQAALELLRPIRWHGYGVWPPVAYPGRIPMIFSQRWYNASEMRAYLLAHPGSVVAMQNEPNVPGQAQETVAQAITTTLSFFEMARIVPSWQWTSPAVSINQDNGAAWIGAWADAMYQLPDSLVPPYFGMSQNRGHIIPPFWTVHPYRSPRLSLFRQSWALWLTTMASRLRGSPTIMIEVCAEAAPLADQLDIMDECRLMLDRGEVGGVFWYVAFTWPGDPFPNAALCTVNGSSVALTTLGQHWMSLK